MVIIRLNEKENFEDLHAKLAAIPTTKRQVLILVGRHPNEGTHLIARKYHKIWEMMGATVIQIPRGHTPQVIWNKFQQGKTPEVNQSNFPTDEHISQLLKQYAPVINFHATIRKYAQNKLDIGHDGNLLSNIQKQQLGIKSGSSDTDDNQVIVEYMAKGLPRKKQTLVRFDSYAPGMGHISPTYINHHVITSEALTHFAKLNVKFLQIIRHLKINAKNKHHDN